MSLIYVLVNMKQKHNRILIIIYFFYSEIHFKYSMWNTNVNFVFLVFLSISMLIKNVYNNNNNNILKKSTRCMHVSLDAIFKNYTCHMWNKYCLPFRSTWDHPCFSGVSIAWSVVFCDLFCRSPFFSFCPLSFGHCIICPSIYGFLLPFGIFKRLFYTAKPL